MIFLKIMMILFLIIHNLILAIYWLINLDSLYYLERLEMMFLKEAEKRSIVQIKNKEKLGKNKLRQNTNLMGIKLQEQEKVMIIEQLKKMGVELDDKGVRFPDRSYFWDDHSFVFTLPRTDQKNGTMTCVVAGNAERIPRLMRKLPHYGKYGYLVFEGSAPENRDKGTWQSNPMEMQKVFKAGHPLHLPDQKPLVSFNPYPKP